MQIEGWQYYNHAAIPTTMPYENPDIKPVENGNIWQIRGGAPLLARWTSEFDCRYETQWWYVIKDTPFDISKLKAKRRYEVNKGVKHFDVKVIDPREYRQELYRIQVAAFSVYPKKYRPKIEYDEFIESVETWDSCVVFGAFFRETGLLAGYAMLSEPRSFFVEFNVLKTDPEYERHGSNAALVEAVLSNYSVFLKNGGIICDGARNINHETHFQDYLEKYFGFRKAYCRLHIRYNPKIAWAVKMLYPFRSLLEKIDGIGVVHQINGVLKMEEICRGKESAE